METGVSGHLTVYAQYHVVVERKLESELALILLQVMVVKFVQDLMYK